MSSPDPDFSLIERLRKENSDQFFTLVRMHLSFLVDINTDDVDCSTDKPKQFRWNFHKKLKNGAANSSQSNSSTKNCVELNSITEQGIARAYELIDFLSKEENVTQEGIFRRTGSLTRQQELRQLLLTGSSLGLDEGRFSVHDCASVLKGFLAELPQPLLCDQYYQTYCTLAAQYPPNVETTEPKLLTALQLLLLLLSPLHRSFLERLLGLLRMAADNEASNRMSPDTLATMFTPHLLCPRKLSPSSLHTDAVALAPIVSVMIRRARSLFAPPAPLLADVAAYLAARDNRPALDESVTDRTAASTIYTFVDRHRTSVENRSNPTECALAQLYAHIHSLPDSQHKRRLVKQFNRQNGYGTPIQVQRTSRSLGDSIKRHIFQKGLLNKTPKKGSAADIATVEEKNSAKEKPRYDEVTPKKVLLKNIANKMASSESLDDEFDSDTSNESTLSDGALNVSKKRSPKFVSEPNLSSLESRGEDETPKNTKKRGSRLFRSKILSASQNLNKRYQKRGAVRATPTSCVSCVDEQDTGSEHDATDNNGIIIVETPKKTVGVSAASDQGSLVKLHYLTSTPGLPEVVLDDDVTTPYTMNFRRASMSPITKSTQKLSKAMQESIMTPRSRKPLIITSEQRDTLPEGSKPHADLSKSDVYHSMSNNDSDFVSSDDDNFAARTSQVSLNDDNFPARSSQVSLNDDNFPARTSQVSLNDDNFPARTSQVSLNDDNFPARTSQVSLDKSTTSAARSESTHFVINSDRRKLEDLNTTLQPQLPKFKIDEVVTDFKPTSLSEPFREYLLSRSVLTATPVDLSILNKSDNTEENISESLLYCLDGNVPTDLTASIGSLAVDKNVVEVARSPFKNINNIKLAASKSPSRKRGAKEDHNEREIKKALVEKENILSCDEAPFELRETDL